MRHIVLVCSAGMSTSMLMQKMRQAAAAEGYECTVDAYPMSDVRKIPSDTDIVLLAPQIRFQASKIKEQVSCPVAAMEMSAYGLMDGAKMISTAKEALGD